MLRLLTACAAANSWCRGRTRGGRGLGLKQVRGIVVMGGPFKRARGGHGLELEGNTRGVISPKARSPRVCPTADLCELGVVTVLSWRATPERSSARRRDRQGCAKQVACAAANSWCRGRTREGRGLGLKQVRGITVMGGPFKPARGHGLELEGNTRGVISPKARSPRVCPTADLCSGR
jgi:hypothetical protein